MSSRLNPYHGPQDSTDDEFPLRMRQREGRRHPAMDAPIEYVSVIDVRWSTNPAAYLLPAVMDIVRHLPVTPEFLPLLNMLISIHEKHILQQMNAAVPIRNIFRTLPLFVSPYRPEFTADPEFMLDDIAARAIPNLEYSFNLLHGMFIIKDLTNRLRGNRAPSYELESLRFFFTIGPEYQIHANRKDLGKEAMKLIDTGCRIKLQYPLADGEVMYVITPDHRIIIAPRGGSEHSLPHPTLVSGIASTVLAAGIVYFKNGLIFTVGINESGHFKPNFMSAVETAMVLFSLLPPTLFHPEFSFKVFKIKDPLFMRSMLRSGAAPAFDIVDAVAPKASCNTTQAMIKRTHMVSMINIIDTTFTPTISVMPRLNRAKKEVFKTLSKMLINSICNGVELTALFQLLSADRVAPWRELVNSGRSGKDIMTDIESRITVQAMTEDLFNALLKTLGIRDPFILGTPPEVAPQEHGENEDNGDDMIGGFDFEAMAGI